MPAGIAGREVLPQQHTEIVREIGVRLVDRLVLAEEASQFLAQCPGTGLERGIGEPLGGLDRIGRRPADACRQSNSENKRALPVRAY